MWRLLIISTLIPFILCGACANLMGLRVLAGCEKLNIDVETLLRKILRQMSRKDIKIQFSKKLSWQNNDEKVVKLPIRYRESRNASDAAQAAISLAMLLLHEKHPSLVRWRMNTIKLGYILPSFSLLIVLFSFIIGKLPAVILLVIIAVVLGFCSVMLWLSMGVEKEAAHLMVSRIEKLRVLSSLRDEESLVTAIKATPWVSLIPGALLKLIAKH